VTIEVGRHAEAPTADVTRPGFFTRVDQHMLLESARAIEPFVTQQATMPLLSPTWLRTAVLGIVVVVRREGRVGERYGHLIVVNERRKGRMVMPERGGIDSWRWEFIGDLQRLEVDRGGR